MGDRTSVTLYVLTSQKERVKVISDSFEELEEDGDLTYFYFSGVNYGELSFLNELMDAGIAFDSCWCAGSDYGAGTKSCRFTPAGELDVREVYETQENPPLSVLMSLIDSPNQLREYIIQHRDKVTPLSWDNQEEYGKLHRTKKLISPKE